MAPSTTLQSRISAFESMNSASSSSPRSPPKFPPKVSVNLLETPIPASALSFSPIIPSTPKPTTVSPSPSPPNLGRKTSLIDLKDWVVEDGPGGHLHNGHTNGKVTSNSTGSSARLPSDSILPSRPNTAPLINLESPPKSRIRAPPLPPRKPSYNSLRTASASSSTSKPRSDSLTVDHTYPPLAHLDTGSSGSRKGGHAAASSVSSFHSISLSSDGGTDVGTPTSITNHLATYPMDRYAASVDSLDESYENISASAISPSAAIVHNWEKRPEPPKLPQRPKPPTISTPSSSPPAASASLPTSPRATPAPSTARRPPPPPPSTTRSRPNSARTSVASTSASDRSSILSIGTTASRTSISTFGSIQTKRPTPIPPAARKRYESVFISNVLNRRKASSPLSPAATRNKRSAAGWRGLSVDLITNPEEHPLSPTSEAESEFEEVGVDERLEGLIVQHIWSASKLERRKLKDIWSECDPAGQGSLDLDSFVKGMWRIDEELRRAQLTRKASSGSHRIRQPRTNSKLVLR
ncbi:hypothetical protein JAAARDRAFT_173762 [Jaapia argillacea MUCL 33604]|uniref:EH domain-containing protein n=1 Tax=Jaapia argillacea MUCL 33604 TaxID=933084 RepID=A0A067Q4T5_9AGAM|nr:hypothetical protein JAAARDRAFT_173762 [Jaapia argillacea MUCL 33604]